MSDSIERYIIVLCLIFFLYFDSIQTIGDKKQLENFEETKEEQREKELEKIYSSSKANAFLSYDKCIQRMKCPINRQEQCNEECKAGNTEEEVEEHEELTRDEHQTSLKQRPKRKFEGNLPLTKQQTKKNKPKSNAKIDL